jgi:VWFA-related protein
MHVTSSLSRRDLLRFCAAAVPLGRVLAWQQDAKQDPKYSTSVSVVNVLATVRDKNGKMVNNLTQTDFTLVEDDHPQTIRYFSQQSDLPLTLGLLVDTSLSQRRVLDRERNASIEFLEHVLREDKDKAFVIHFDREVELLQDLTSSRKDLEDSLRDLNAGRPNLNRRGSDPPDDGGRDQERGRMGTALYDSVLLASDEIMRKQQGRKASILLSDGVDYQSKVTIGSAIEAAQRADMLVYSIWIADPDAGGGGGFQQPRRGPQVGVGIPGIGGRRGGGGGPGGPGGGRYPQQQQRNPNEGKKTLQRISTETGGAYFEVTSKMPLDKIYDRIEEDLRNQYSLGYTPDPPSGGFHRIHLTVKQKGLVVQTREGYYPAS